MYVKIFLIDTKSCFIVEINLYVDTGSILKIINKFYLHVNTYNRFFYSTVNSKIFI